MQREGKERAIAQEACKEQTRKIFEEVSQLRVYLEGNNFSTFKDLRQVSGEFNRSSGSILHSQRFVEGFLNEDPEMVRLSDLDPAEVAKFKDDLVAVRNRLPEVEKEMAASPAFATDYSPTKEGLQRMFQELKLVIDGLGEFESEDKPEKLPGLMTREEIAASKKHLEGLNIK
ncbi:MAG: hypothetical protein WCX71_05790 [Candidatus Buchananbacteria bacterium]